MKSLRDKNRFTKDQQHLNFVENHFLERHKNEQKTEQSSSSLASFG